MWAAAEAVGGAAAMGDQVVHVGNRGFAHMRRVTLA